LDGPEKGLQVKVDFLKSEKPEKSAAGKLTIDEMEALRLVAYYKGKNWKSWLIEQWPSGKYPGFDGEDRGIGGELQSVRNKIGPKV